MTESELIGARLKSLREGAGLTQTAVAEKTNIDYCTISLIESGNRGLNASKLFRLAVLFNVTSDYIIGPDDTQ